MGAKANSTVSIFSSSSGWTGAGAGAGSRLFGLGGFFRLSLVIFRFLICRVAFLRGCGLRSRDILRDWLVGFRFRLRSRGRLFYRLGCRLLRGFLRFRLRLRGLLFCTVGVILRNFGNHFDVLAVQVHQALFERIRFLLYCHKLLLGQLHLIAGALFTILRLNVGGTNDLGSFLLGFLDDVLAKALGIDHGCAQGIFARHGTGQCAGPV